MRKRLAYCAVAVVLSVASSVTNPAGAQEVGADPVDDLLYNVVNCGPHANRPTYDFGFPDITGTGGVYNCRGDVSVHVCLVYNGVPLPLCGTGDGNGSAEASTTVPCLPGTWQTVAIQDGGAADPSEIVVIGPGMCDPLRP